MFSGEFWTAKTALGYGVIDRLIDLRSFLRERYGDQVLTPLISSERSLFGWRKPGVGSLVSALTAGRSLEGAGLVDEAISAIESRGLWSRFGL